jgi:hypothetical protein
MKYFWLLLLAGCGHYSPPSSPIRVEKVVVTEEKQPIVIRNEVLTPLPVVPQKTVCTRYYLTSCGWHIYACSDGLVYKCKNKKEALELLKM